MIWHRDKPAARSVAVCRKLNRPSPREEGDAPCSQNSHLTDWHVEPVESNGVRCCALKGRVHLPAGATIHPQTLFGSLCPEWAYLVRERFPK